MRSEDSTTLMVKTRGYEGMTILLDSNGAIHLLKGAKTVESAWANSDCSAPTDDDDVYALIKKYRTKWMKKYSPSVWANI
jgi:hypothetical protein